jgi:hypothetical protein
MWFIGVVGPAEAWSATNIIGLVVLVVLSGAGLWWAYRVTLRR